MIQWGALDDTSVRDMIAILEQIRHPTMPPAGRLLVDFRDVHRVEGAVLLRFAALARERLPDWSPRVARQAVIIPEGEHGMLLAGALPSAAPEHPLRYVRTLDDAIAFLGAPEARVPHLAAMATATAAREQSPLTARLRGQLAGNLIDASMECSAAALGVSKRTLQRDLERHGTSFRDELRRARLAAAEDLLASSDAKIDTIAIRVGFANGSQLNTMLRRERNLTANALRARLRERRRP
jgi:AraC-like DNA-binding protein